VKVAAALSDSVKVQELGSEKDQQSKEDVNIPQNSKISSNDVECCGTPCDRLFARKSRAV